MAISFPSTPSANQSFTVGNKSWIWNGYAWDLVVQNLSPIYTQANDSYIYASSTANNAYITANNAWAKANAANTIASSAYNNANSAYNAANNKLDLGGGTVTGPVTISSTLLVTGNVTFSGNVTTVSANNLSVKDNMIYLNNESNVANPDLGFAGNYNDGIYHHAGFFRDSTDGIWKVFDNYEPEPDLSPWIDTSNNTFRIANFQANTITANVINIASSSLIANLNSDFLDGQHGSYYTNLSIAAFGNANLAFDRANTAYAQANASYTYASSTANNAYNTANAAWSTANNAYNTANVAWAAANTKASITGYTTNSIIFANSSGYISNSSSLSFYSSNNNIVTSGLVVNRLILANDNIIIGNLAGATSPGSGTIAIGSQAGYLNQRNYSIALGFYAGGNSQGDSSIAIGPSAGYDTQSAQSIAIGSGTASYGQGNNAVAIGTSAGNLSQGNNSIAIGKQAGYSGQIANSIILNSSDSALNATTYSGLYINPIRYNTASIANLIFYDISTKELTYAPVSSITSNAAYNTANAAYSVANTAWAGANASYTYASSTANNAYATANAAWAGANASYTYASSTANNAYITANNAWAKANAAAATSNVSSNLVTTNVTTGTYYPFLSPSVSGNNAVYANNTLSYNVSNGSLSANNLLLQNDGTNAYIRPTNFNSALYLGANNANILALGKTSTTAYGTLSDTDVGVNFYIQNKDSTSARYPGLIIENYAGSLSTGMSVIELKRARGTSISPTSVVLGDLLGGFNTWGQNGSGFQSATRIQGYAANTFSTAISAGLQFFTTIAGTQTEAARIDEYGRVGIGSTSPSNWYALTPQLLITKSQNAETILGIGNPTVGASAQAGIRIIGGTGSSYVISRLNDNNGSPFFINDFGSGVNYTSWSFGGSEKLRLDSSGNVGIANTAAEEKLHVGGNVLLNNNYYLKFKTASNTSYNALGVDTLNTTRLYAPYGVLHLNPDGTNLTYLNYNTPKDVVIGDGTSVSGLVINKGTLSVTSNVTASWLVKTKSSTISNDSGIWIDSSNNIQFAARDGAGTLRVLIDSNANSVSYINANNVGIGTTTPSYKLQVNGSFAATTKSFVIDHPTKPKKKLRYGSLESPYHGVRLTGESSIIDKFTTINLPDYIHGLCKKDGAQIQITNIKHGKVIWVEKIDIENDSFTVGMNRKFFDKTEYKFYWSLTAIRKDIEEIVVEIDDE